ncbi:MAG: nucleoside-triphosphatase [Bacteroidota bacterium]
MIFITSGAKGSGKTTFQYQIIRHLQQKGIQVSGFLAFHDFQTDSYSIYNIQTQETLKLAQRVSLPEKSNDPFQFIPNTVLQGKKWIKETLDKAPDLVVIDEIGIYELNGKVWCEEFTGLCNSSIPLLFSTNINWLPMIQKQWRLNPTHIFYPEAFRNPEQAAKQIYNSLRH